MKENASSIPTIDFIQHCGRRAIQVTDDPCRLVQVDPARCARSAMTDTSQERVHTGQG